MERLYFHFGTTLFAAERLYLMDTQKGSIKLYGKSLKIYCHIQRLLEGKAFG